MIQSKPARFGSRNLHAHPFHEIGLVLRGECLWNQNGRRPVPVVAGQAIWVPPGHLHREESTGPVQLGWIGFTLKGVPSAKPLRPVSLGENLEAILALTRQIGREQHLGEEDSGKICSLALQQILLMVRRSGLQRSSPTTTPALLNPRQIQIVRSVAAYLDQNRDRPLSLEQVAQYHNLSAPHLSMLFKKHYHATPTAYRLKGRIAHARELLGNPTLSVKEIASSCGYTDTAHFCREFKRLSGKSPGLAR